MGARQKLIKEATSRIVTAAQPVRIVLFGSAVRGKMGPNSDLDLLVVMPDNADRLVTARKLHRALRGLGCAKDIVVVLQSDVESHGDNPYMVLHTALTEGREVYCAA